MALPCLPGLHLIPLQLHSAAGWLYPAFQTLDRTDRPHRSFHREGRGSSPVLRLPFRISASAAPTAAQSHVSMLNPGIEQLYYLLS